MVLGLFILTACTESRTVDQILPYWDRPVATSPSVLEAAKQFDPTGRPFPTLSSVPDRPDISASDRIASLENELVSDRARADELRATGQRPDAPSIDGIGGLEEFAVEPAPEAPTLGRVPKIDLSGGGNNTVRLPLNEVDEPVELGDDGLPRRDLSAPTPPPRLADIPAPPPLEAPQEPVIESLAVPEPIDERPPEFVVEPIADASPASQPDASVVEPPSEGDDVPQAVLAPVETPPVAAVSPPPPPAFEPAPTFEPAPLAIDPPPDMELAAVPNLDPPATTVPLSRAPVLKATAWIDVDDDGALIPSAAEELDAIIADGAQEGSRTRYRLVGYADGDAVTADTALGRARLISEYMQAQNIQRGRLILAPPEVLSNDPRIGSVAVFVLP